MTKNYAYFMVMSCCAMELGDKTLILNTQTNRLEVRIFSKDTASRQAYQQPYYNNNVVVYPGHCANADEDSCGKTFYQGNHSPQGYLHQFQTWMQANSLGLAFLYK